MRCTLFFRRLHWSVLLGFCSPSYRAGEDLDSGEVMEFQVAQSFRSFQRCLSRTNYITCPKPQYLRKSSPRRTGSRRSTLCRQILFSPYPRCLRRRCVLVRHAPTRCSEMCLVSPRTHCSDFLPDCHTLGLSKRIKVSSIHAILSPAPNPRSSHHSLHSFSQCASVSSRICHSLPPSPQPLPAACSSSSSTHGLQN